MIRRDPGRFDLLAPVRQFVEAAAPADRDAISRHAAWAEAWVDARCDQGTEILLPELHNIHHAIVRLSAPDPDRAARFMLKVVDLAYERGAADLFVAHMETLRAAVTSEPLALRLDLAIVAIRTQLDGPTATRARAKITALRAHALGERDVACEAAAAAFVGAAAAGEDDADDWLARAVAHDGAVGPRAQVAVWSARSHHALQHGDLTRALADAHRISNHHRHRNATALPLALIAEARIARALAQPDDALVLLREAHDVARQQGLHATAIHVQIALSKTLLDTRDPTASLELLATAAEAGAALGRPVPARWEWIGAMAHALSGDDTRSHAAAQRARTPQSLLLQGTLRQVAGDLEAAGIHFADAASLASPWWTPVARWFSATVAAATHADTDADVLLAEADVPDPRRQQLHRLCVAHVAHIRTHAADAFDGPLLPDQAAPERHDPLRPTQARWCWIRLRKRLLTDPRTAP